MKITGNTISLLIYDQIQKAVGSEYDAWCITQSIMELEEIQALLKEHEHRVRQSLVYRCMSASESRKATWPGR